MPITTSQEFDVHRLKGSVRNTSSSSHWRYSTSFREAMFEAYTCIEIYFVHERGFRMAVWGESISNVLSTTVI